MNLANIIPILMQGKGSLSLAVTDTFLKFLADIDSDTGVKTHADAKIGTADTDTTIRRISISKCIGIGLKQGRQEEVLFTFKRGTASD